MDSPSTEHVGRDWVDVALARWPILSWMAILGAVGGFAAVYIPWPATAERFDRIATWAASGAVLALTVGLTGRYWRVAKWLWGVPIALILGWLAIDEYGWDVLWWGLALFVAKWAWDFAASLIDEHFKQQRQIIEQLEELNRRLGR